MPPLASKDAAGVAKIAVPFVSVRKRDGRIVPFDAGRIESAVYRAMKAVNEGDKMHDPKRIADQVVTTLRQKYPKDHMPTIEEIQDVVEETLIVLDFAKTAKAYILYRHERARLREREGLISEKARQLVLESKKYFRNPLSEFVYYRTYSRWIDAEGRRETWIETVQRYVDFMRENLGEKLTDAEYAELREAILWQEVMPSMRLLWSGGKAARSNNICAYNCSFIAPTKLEDFAEILYLSMSGCGVGFSVESHAIQQLPIVQRQTGKNPVAFVIEDSKEGWCDALTFGIKTWYAGGDAAFDFSKLRPAGARLYTMGGRSSGPDPLRSLLEFTKAKILTRQGKRLKNIDAHDIICKIGEVVVVGGVRRTALISLSDIDDEEMRHAKTGQFYVVEPQRSMANNSVAYNSKPVNTVFMEEWLALAKSGTGERGIFNRGGLKAQMPERRWKINAKHRDSTGTNPCVTDDTWVMTAEGARQVKVLVSRPFEALIDGKKFFSPGFFKTGDTDVYEIKTSRGFSFRATANHKVRVVEYRSRKTQRNIWKEVGDLVPGDRIVLHRHSDTSWSGFGTEKEGWLLGSLLGDGNIEKNGKVNLDFWGPHREVMMAYAKDLVHDTVNARSDLTGHYAKTGYARVGSMGLGTLATSFGMTYAHKVVTKEIEESSSYFYKGFLRGWFDADGSVQGNLVKGVSIRLSANGLDNLYSAQRMLARLEVISTVYQNRRTPAFRMLPDGKGGMQSYFCEANHELVITGENLGVFAKHIGFSDPSKKKRLQEIMQKYRRVMNRETFSSEVTTISYAGVFPVYDCQVPNVHAFDGNGVYLHNCGEITLRSKEFCNLSEIVARAEDTEETLLKKARLATIFGTYQSTLTNFPYLSPEWKKNCDEERLLGVSITGQWDSPAVRDASVFQKMREVCIETNKEFAARFGITPSMSITCVKPSGNVSQLVDAASGMHPRHSRFYIRRVRISSTDPLFHMLRDQKFPSYPEVGQTMDSATTFVLEFPVASPGGSLFKDDQTARDQLEYWKMVKENFTEHNPSVTVSVSDDEWLETAHWLYQNWDMIGGLSFLPRTKHVYRLAPYEEVSEERYNELVAHLPKIDFSHIMMYEREDQTQGSKELACVAGICEVDFTAEGVSAVTA